MGARRRRIPIDRYATVTLHEDELALLIQLVSRLHWGADHAGPTDVTADELRALIATLGQAWEIIKDRERRYHAHTS
jgi:hypothetical protein